MKNPISFEMGLWPVLGGCAIGLFDAKLTESRVRERHEVHELFFCVATTFLICGKTDGGAKRHFLLSPMSGQDGTIHQFLVFVGEPKHRTDHVQEHAVLGSVFASERHGNLVTMFQSSDQRMKSLCSICTVLFPERSKCVHYFTAKSISTHICHLLLLRKNYNEEKT